MHLKKAKIFYNLRYENEIPDTIVVNVIRLVETKNINPQKWEKTMGIIDINPIKIQANKLRSKIIGLVNE